MLQRYESLILSVPEITQDEIKTLESQIERLVKGSKGSMISFEKWGKFKLSYPVKKNDYGIYFLARFEIPSNTTVIEDFRSLCAVKFDDIVMRNMATLLSEDDSLVYQRPHSLEEAPTRDVRTFLKENKMEGLLSSVDKTDKKEAKPAVAKVEEKVEVKEEVESNKE